MRTNAHPCMSMRMSIVRYSADPVDVGAHTDLICASRSGISAQPPTIPTADYPRFPSAFATPLRAQEAPQLSRACASSRRRDRASRS